LTGENDLKKVDSTRGIVDCGIGMDTKSSPRLAAIRKAQAKLRQEYDAVDEQRREIGFLEKGGNPLDFKFGRVASFRVQSTSMTDQLAEQHLTREANGSFASAASHHGDSVGNNLLPFEGDSNSFGGVRNVKCSNTRTNLALFKQSEQHSALHNAKCSGDPLICRLGVKNQANVRRDKNTFSRKSAKLDIYRGKRSLVISSSCPDYMDSKRSKWEPQAKGLAVSSISNSKSAIQIGSVESKSISSNDCVGMKLNWVPNHYESSNQQPHIAAESVITGTTSVTSEAIGKEGVSATFDSIPFDSAENLKEASILHRNSLQENDNVISVNSPDNNLIEPRSVHPTISKSVVQVKDEAEVCDSSSTSILELSCSRSVHLKFAKKAQEDAILRESRIIEANLLKAGELSCNLPLDQRRCHWDFVLKEMAWMANDFVQERLWKSAAAAKLSHSIARKSREKLEERNMWQKQDARTLAKSIMQFKHSAETRAVMHGCNKDMLGRKFTEAEDKKEEEGLFYVVPRGAMHFYGELVESHWVLCQKMGNNVHQEICKTSMCDSVGDEHKQNAHEEDEGETRTYLLSRRYDGGFALNSAHKKRKPMQQKTHAEKVFEVGVDVSCESCREKNLGNQPMQSKGKRPSSSLNVSPIPTKRMRTAARQWIASPFDVSSRNTNSYGDNQSLLLGGSLPRKNIEVTMQMSNISNQNKLTKTISSWDHGRKSKVLKMATDHSGSGNPWSDFEDQALLVLVHDMGPNWELVCDALNCTLLFKSIFRKPKECRDRLKLLGGYCSNSVEDSGSSQPYNFTLHGIPKGKARLLLDVFQEPRQLDSLKAHLDKIIFLGQQLRSCHSQNQSQHQKQVAQTHSSHVVALSQACPNKLARSILTPLDLCDSIASSQDILPTLNADTVRGSPAMSQDNSLFSTSAALSPLLEKILFTSTSSDRCSSIAKCFPIEIFNNLIALQSGLQI
ncbi:chromatin modification-related protein EAF1 B-like, partial [Ananas comosus]|uniref:Chromatin modification-related protein EAF1 B-like n=1 Tax=Ananas comosus TaxID=4615 RepID=A0A6P5ECZ1_ANACO